MERALKFTNKSADGKYMKLVASPLKAQAFEAARNANEFARKEVLASMDKTVLRTVGIKEKHSSVRQNSATMIFEKTGGRHELLLDHEREETAKKEEQVREREERKKTQEERKRRRIEEEDRREERKRQKKAREEEAAKKLKEASCRIPGCRFSYYSELVRASLWISCHCNKFYICPSHGGLELVNQLQQEHLKDCEEREK